VTVYSFDYSTTYEPAAPVVDITIRKAGRSRSEITLSALVDSGADATMLPITALQATKARYVETRQMRGIIGTAYPVDLYLVTVQMGSYTLSGIRAIAAAADAEPIIGRDVLNQLIITLNGLAGVTEVSR
jgi:predicted aspartyl protease